MHMHNLRECLIIFVSCLLISACGHTTAEKVKASVNAPKAEIALFSHCSSYGCQKVQQVSFEPDEWQSIISSFDKMPDSAEAERELLPQAIALMEKVVGPKTGTEDDIGKSWLFTLMPKGQLDCIDESINTTTYLELLNDAGFIKYHNIGRIALRGGGIDFKMLHNTATLIQKDNGDSYAIDSWFRANGVKPDVMPLNIWLDGWGPNS